MRVRVREVVHAKEITEKQSKWVGKRKSYSAVPFIEFGKLFFLAKKTK